MGDIPNFLVYTFQAIERHLPSATLLSSLAILISLIATSISLYQSVTAKHGKIVVSLHIIYSVEELAGSVDPKTYREAEISVINLFTKAKYIKEVYLRFPANKQKRANDFCVSQEQFNIRPGELRKIPVQIKQEYLEYFNIHGLSYNANLQVRAILVDTHNKKWISQDGLTPGNIFSIVKTAK